MISTGGRFLQACSGLALIVLLSVLPGWTQEVRARLSGTVKDPAGAVVPEAGQVTQSVNVEAAASG
jgi:hypothetical protein